MVIRTAIDTNIRLSRATSRRLKITQGIPSAIVSIWRSTG